MRPAVLCVDDDPTIGEILQLELDDHFEVLTTRSGVDALDMLSHLRIDAILLDLNMLHPKRVRRHRLLCESRNH